jgi:hypothetical protein
MTDEPNSENSLKEIPKVEEEIKTNPIVLKDETAPTTPTSEANFIDKNEEVDEKLRNFEISQEKTNEKKEKKKRNVQNELEEGISSLLFPLFCSPFYILIGTVFFYVTETQLEFSDALYMTATSLTTVGYGDFSPKTGNTKFFNNERLWESFCNVLHLCWFYYCWVYYLPFYWLFIRKTS